MEKATGGAASPREGPEPYASWVPLIVVVLAQVQMAFNINALPVSVGPIVEDLNTPATSIATALVIYALFVAAFVLLGAKIGELFGVRRVFRASVILHAIAMGMMTFSTDATKMYLAQAVAGLAAALLVPTLVALIAASYTGMQQARALGVLAGVAAIAGALAFLIAGFLGTAMSWRYSFGLLVFLAIAVLLWSSRLPPVAPRPVVKIDGVGAVFAAVAIALISFGFNNLNSWGVLLAGPAAPFALLGLSPAPFMIVLGLVAGQAFFVWTRSRVAENKAPLLSLEVLGSPYERSALYALLIIGALGPAINFLVPLYIQIVQGRTSMFTAVAVVPYALSIAGAAVMVIWLYAWFSPRQIAIPAFMMVAAGLVMLALTIRNEWSTPTVVAGLVVTGLGEGALLTLMFNVLVAMSPRSLAGEVGALRGVANNLSTALGTAFVSVVAVGILSVMVMTSLNRSPIPESLKTQVNLDNIDFITNAQLERVLSNTTATPEQVAAAVQINQDARLRALKASFMILAGIALLALFPANGLPDTLPRGMRERAGPGVKPIAA